VHQVQTNFIKFMRASTRMICVSILQSFIAFLLYNFFFFFNATATTDIYTLSLHDALPIFFFLWKEDLPLAQLARRPHALQKAVRSEEHTSELQSRFDLVCRLLLEKKKNLCALR